tara:strand:+ start:4978 stop:5874 length:897 start_codon:yes stop_codon:yes gene_type:complete
MSPLAPPKRAYGVALTLMLGYALFYALLWVSVRQLSMDLHPFVLVFYRTLFGLLFILPSLCKLDLGTIRAAPRPLYLLRAALNITSVFGAFYAVSHIPLADAVAYSYAAPLFATLLAAIFLGETIRLPRLLGVACGFTGVLILLRPGFQDINAGMLAALASAAAFAGTLITIKILTRRDHPGIVTLYGYLFGLPISFFIALFYWQWPRWDQIPLLLFMGLCSGLAHFCLAGALSKADMTALLPVDFTRLIFASLIGYFLFTDALDGLTYLGGLIILGSSVYVVYRENRKRHQANQSKL